MSDAGERGAVSPAEARFEARMRRAGLWLGPLAAAAAATAAHGLPADQATLSAIMALSAVWWLTEPIPMPATAFLAAASAVLLGVAPAKQAFAAFGNPLILLFFGSFFVAEAIKVQGLGARLAAALARVARTRLSLLIGLSSATCLLSMWTSNVAAAAVALPIAVAAADATGDRRFGACLVLSVAWGASVGGIGTPVGTPPNLIGMSALAEAGHSIGFLRWMALCVPLAAIMMAALWLVLGAMFGVRPLQRTACREPDCGASGGTPVGPLQRTACREPDCGASGGTPVGSSQALPVVAAERLPWSQGEKAVAGALSAAVVAWLLPGLLAVIAPGAAVTAWVGDRLTEEVIALVCGCSLFVLPGAARGGPARPALTWSEAARIDWGVIVLFAGGAVLGDLARSTGLAATWGESLMAWTGAETTWTMTALTTGAALLLSEATSNTATATLIAPLSVALAQAAGVSPIPPVLGATLGASFGFMLPISTGPNAMAYATRMVRVPQMMRAGVIFDLVGFAIIVAGLRLLCPLLGLD